MEEQMPNLMAMKMPGSTIFFSLETKIGHVVVKDLTDAEVENVQEELELFRDNMANVMQTLQKLL